MDVQEYMKLPYNYIIHPIHDESGVYFHASVLELDGCQSTGDTIDEAMDGLKEAMEGWIDTKLANGFSIPIPVDTESFSGKFNIRIPKSLHFRLSVEAEREGVSLNQYALYKLCN
jgi:predicted RNase H-like HicB family nuclease